MPQRLRFGRDSVLELHLPHEKLVADCSAPRAAPLDDPAAAVAAALASPLDFPPLRQAAFPGDQVLLALEDGLPQADVIVAGVVSELLAADVRADDVTVLLAKPADAEGAEPTALLADERRSAVHLAAHDPADATSMAYLAATKAGHAIYLNRQLCDADVVVPIGVARLNPATRSNCVCRDLYPAFSNQETIQLFGQSQGNGLSAPPNQFREEADEAAWLLGVQFIVRVVPGPGDTILHVLAGQPEAVAKRSRRLCAAAWQFDVPRQADLVVAAIEGGSQQQTWENLLRSLSAAARAVEDDGTIVICTELQQLWSSARTTSGGLADEDWGQRPYAAADSHASPLDAIPVLSKRNVRVFLLSGLDSDVVEEMSIGYVSHTDEIARLCQRHRSCTLLANAQHAVVATPDS